MGIKCPNKSLPSWKKLVEVQGETLAYYYWNEHDGNIPESLLTNVKPTSKKVRPLTEESNPLYKDKNLLNKQGEIKTFPSESKAKEVAASKSRSPYYDFEARKTPTGWKVFIVEDIESASEFFGNNQAAIDAARLKDEADAQRQVDEDLARGGRDPFYSLEKPVIKEGVDFVFEQNPELSKIGTEKQYSQYLKTIFPDSQLKDIMYHTSTTKRTSFKVGEKGAIWFTHEAKQGYEYGNIINAVILNTKNIGDGVQLLSDKYDEFTATDWINKEDVKEFKSKGYDSLKGFTETGNISEFLVFEPNQIHILGSKKDIQKFKEFTKKPQYQIGKDKSEVNQELDSKLKDLLSNLGISIESFEAFKDKYDVDAIAAADIVNGIIHYDESTANQLTLPEETAHFVIELMGHSPLQQRLLALVEANDYYKELLGDDYTNYHNAYDGNRDMLIKEAAGKLLAQALVSQFNNEMIQIPQQQVTLAKRLWNWVKNLFSKVDKNTWTKEIAEVYGQTAEQFLAGDLRGLSKDNLTMGKVMWQLSDSSLKGLKRAVKTARDKSAKRLEVYRRKDKKKFAAKEEKNLKELVKNFDDENFLLGAVKTVQHSRKMFKDVNGRLSEVEKQFENLDTVNLKKAAGVLRDMKLFKDSYGPVLKDLKNEINRLIREEPNVGRYKTIKKVLVELIDVSETLENSYFELSVPLFSRYLGKFVGDGPMKDLESALRTAEGDITFWQRWLDAMAEANDPILQLIDVAVKEAKQEAMQDSYPLQKDLIQSKMDLEKAGIKDAEWIYELDSRGNPTGNIITKYNEGEYMTAMQVQFNTLLEKYNLPKDASERAANLAAHPVKKRGWGRDWKKWHDENTQENPDAKAIIDEKKAELSTEDFNEWFNDNTYIFGDEIKFTRELALPSNKYKNPAFADIQNNKAKKAFYDTIVKIKDEMDNLLPEQYASGNLAPQLRKDFIERLKSIKTAEDLGKFKEEVRDAFFNVEDTTELGSSLNRTESGSVDKKNKFRLTDEADMPVNFLPIHFTKKLSNMDTLSTDIVASMSAYVMMAQDYSKMSKVIDLLEIGRDLVSTRDVVQTDSKGNKLKERINLLTNRVEEKLIKKPGATKAAERLDDYYKMVVYGQQKAEGKDVDVMGIKFNSERLIDFIGRYTAINNLALNIYAGLQNPLIGNAMIRVEGFSKEFVDNGDLWVADKTLTKEMPNAIGQIGSRMHTNWLDLYRERFDVQQDFEERTRGTNAERKTWISKMFKGSSLFFINNIGEYYMQTKMSLALANRVKLKDKNGNDITLLQAYEIDGNRLKLKEGVTKPDGTAWTNEDERVFIRKQNFVNKRLHGIYNDIDRSAIQHFAVGRLVMMFRKFMMPGFNRRYRKLQYNYEGQAFTEGYYRTTGRFMNILIKDLKKGQVTIMKHWNELSETEKYNMFRTFTEAAYLLAAILLARIAMAVKGEDDDDSWALNMAAYQANRMITEMSFYINPRETWRILQSPAAAVNQVSKLMDFAELMIRPRKALEIIERGKYKGMSRFHRSAINVIPLYDTLYDVTDPESKLMFFVDK